ncbi:MAG: hypothetical protein JWP89_6387 [Schlesneria sp.]|nr:hypothetical protein [Schlesneria sp.]
MNVVIAFAGLAGATPEEAARAEWHLWMTLSLVWGSILLSIVFIAFVTVIVIKKCRQPHPPLPSCPN